MGLADITLLSLVEIYGDFSLRFYAKTNQFTYLAQGIIGYIGVIYYLIESLRDDNVLYVNGMWDGISGVTESIAAYVILGDRLTHSYQYLGLLLVISGIVLLKH
jgi:multidrug transporter EmrE-like cation transporter